jgi:hypothetical protein
VEQQRASRPRRRTNRTQEGVEAKGLRYLAEDRLRVEYVGPSRIRASCRGSGGDVYVLGWLPNEGWFCRCPAYRRCAHLVALQHVVIKPLQEEPE